MTHEQVISLYSSGLSASQVAKQCKLSQWSVYKILRKNGQARRTAVETNRLVFLARPHSFTVVSNPSVSQRRLWQAGLLLYLGEGSKRNNETVDLANCDKRIVLIFLRMLKEIYGVDRTRIRVLIYCHDNKNPSDLISYWSTKTGIPKSQFTKPYIKYGSNGQVDDKMKHGLVHIRYSDKRLWQRIMRDLDLLIERLLG